MVFVLAGAILFQSFGAEWNSETQAERDARMEWWRQARFGMFIHWGLYAIPAGTWKGERIGGIGEWIMDRANIPVADYEPLAKEFNPTQYDPVAWARLAKKAGVKYVVITSKHHDGFCLFDTDTTEWDVVDATPYGKDLLEPLARACREEGIRFCVYYSIMDWHHPAQYRGSEERYNPTKMHEGRKAEYMNYMKQQMRDLMEVCDPEVLWFDGEWPGWYTEEDGREMYAFVKSLKPEIIINNRVGKGRKGMEGLNKGDQEYVGDFGTPEQQIPATGLPGVDWETCMTMNDTWGYKSYDDHWKSPEVLIRNIIDIASKGGNYLLNIGPMANGEIPAPSIERLERIGEWMDTNGASIYGTLASPFERPEWGRITRKDVRRGTRTRLYLHVFERPENGTIVLPKMDVKPLRARLLSERVQVPMEEKDGNTVLTLPDTLPDPIATVIVVDLDGLIS
jgi:alpha-L-fucosidase